MGAAGLVQAKAGGVCGASCRATMQWIAAEHREISLGGSRAVVHVLATRSWVFDGALEVRQGSSRGDSCVSRKGWVFAGAPEARQGVDPREDSRDSGKEDAQRTRENAGRCGGGWVFDGALEARQGSGRRGDSCASRMERVFGGALEAHQ